MANSLIVSDPKNQKNGRGKLFLLLVVSVFILVICGIYVWMNHKKNPLSEITVEGNLYYLTTTEIRDTVNALGPLKTFMYQDVDVIQEAILALPWVNRVSVRKQWPTTIKITITEYQPAAIWNKNQLLDETGIVFDANPKEVKNRKLIALSGPAGSEQEVLQAWIQLSTILRKTGLSIEELVLNERRSWRILTTNKIRIELGLESRTERLERFVKLFDEIKATGEAIDYIDLRYDTGVAVGWRTRKATTN